VDTWLHATLAARALEERADLGLGQGAALSGRRSAMQEGESLGGPELIEELEDGRVVDPQGAAELIEVPLP
jgi:hypothetical protein